MPTNIPLIKNGIVENVIVADYTDICPEGYEFGLQLDGNFEIGYIFDGKKYINSNPSIIVETSDSSSRKIA